MSVLLLPSVVPGGSVSLGLSGGHQHLRNGAALSSPAKKLEGMWGDPHSRQAASIAIGGSGVPVLVNHASVAGMVGLSSPVATEVPIEMIDRDRSIALAQLTQGANSSAAIHHQLSWAQLGSAQQGGQVFLMPTPSSRLRWQTATLGLRSDDHLQSTPMMAKQEELIRQTSLQDGLMWI